MLSGFHGRRADKSGYEPSWEESEWPQLTQGAEPGRRRLGGRTSGRGGGARQLAAQAACHRSIWDVFKQLSVEVGARTFCVENSNRVS